MTYGMFVSNIYSTIVSTELTYYYMCYLIIYIAERLGITVPMRLVNHIVYMRYVCESTLFRLDNGLILLQNNLFGKQLMNNYLFCLLLNGIPGFFIAYSGEMFLSELQYLYDIFIKPFLVESFSKRAVSLQLDLEFKDCLIDQMDKYNSPEEVIKIHRSCVQKISL